MVIHIGGDEDHFVYPPWHTVYPQIQTYAAGNIEDILSRSTGSLRDRITNNGSYGYFMPYTPRPNISWPLTLSLHNDPGEGLQFTFSNPTEAARSIEYEAMDSDQPLEIYIAVGEGDDLDLTRFDLTHSVGDDVSTESEIEEGDAFEMKIDSENMDRDDWVDNVLVMVLVATMTALYCFVVVILVVFCRMVRRKRTTRRRVSSNLSTASSMRAAADGNLTASTGSPRGMTASNVVAVRSDDMVSRAATGSIHSIHSQHSVPRTWNAPNDRNEFQRGTESNVFASNPLSSSIPGDPATMDSLNGGYLSRQITGETFHSQTDFVQDLECETVPDGFNARHFGVSAYGPPRSLDVDDHVISISIDNGTMTNMLAVNTRNANGTLPVPLDDMGSGDSELMYDVRLAEETMTPRGDDIQNM